MAFEQFFEGLPKAFKRLTRLFEGFVKAVKGFLKVF